MMTVGYTLLLCLAASCLAQVPLSRSGPPASARKVDIADSEVNEKTITEKPAETVDEALEEERKNKFNITDDELMSMGGAAFESAKALFASEDSWQVVREDDVSGITAFTLNYTTPNGTLRHGFAVRHNSTGSPYAYYKAYFLELHKQQEYNPSTPVTALLRRLDPNTYVNYVLINVQTPLNLPKRELILVLRSGFVSHKGALGRLVGINGVEYLNKNVPENENPLVVRARGYPGGLMVVPLKGGGSQVTFMLNVDYNYPGLPQSTVDIYDPFNMILFSEAIKNHVEGNDF